MTMRRQQIIVLALGLDPVEREESRQKGMGFAELLGGQSWDELIVAFDGLMGEFVARYEEMAAATPPEYKEFGTHLAAHEKAIGDFAKLEAAGDTANSIAAVARLLNHPLPPPEE